MSVKSFKFVSPGVFIHEIDNSFVPKSAEAIGPVVIGRAARGISMQPVKVESYSEYVEMFGDTVPGFAGGDISRDGNFQSPMYGTYASKAFLRANVAPLNYIRLLGQQSTNASAEGYAGWQTENNVNPQLDSNGGAYGMFLFKSSSATQGKLLGQVNLGEGRLGAIFYVNNSASLQLSGNFISGTRGDWDANNAGQGIGTVIYNHDEGDRLFTVVLTSSNGTYNEKVQFNFDDTSDFYIRKRINTNPQLTSAPGSFYPTSSHKPYWLGATYDQFLREGGYIPGKNLSAVILPLANTASTSIGPHNLREASREAATGWFVGQDTGPHGTSFVIQHLKNNKLFRLKGRGSRRMAS